MDSTTHGYSHWGCARIALREAGVRWLEMALGWFPAAIYLATEDLKRSEPSYQFLMFPAFLLAGELIRAVWRWWRLRGVAVVFDGEYLHIVSRGGVRGLAAFEVAAYLDTPRYLHIVPGRADYELTIRAELDGFTEIRERILAWLPQSAEVVPEQARRKLSKALRVGVLMTAGLMALQWCGKQLGLSLSTWAVLLPPVLIVVGAGFLYREWRAGPPPEDRYNLPREFVW